jgi:hypothetical protein
MANLIGYHLTIISRPLQAVVAHFLLAKYLLQRGTPEFNALAESPDHSSCAGTSAHSATLIRTKNGHCAGFPSLKVEFPITFVSFLTLMYCLAGLESTQGSLVGKSISTSLGPKFG